MIEKGDLVIIAEPGKHEGYIGVVRELDATGKNLIVEYGVVTGCRFVPRNQLRLLEKWSEQLHVSDLGTIACPSCLHTAYGGHGFTARMTRKKGVVLKCMACHKEFPVGGQA